MIVYRGYNKDYPNFGVRPEQNHIWTTNDIDYALEYAKNFDNGGIVEFDIDESLLEVVNEYDCEELFDDWDEFGGIIDADNEMCQTLLDRGYNCVYLDNSGIDCFLILDKNLIKSSKDIPLDIDENAISEEINHILKLSGIQLNEEIVYAESPYEGELENIILKNPTRKELKDNNMTLCRWGYDDDGNYYFWDAYEMIHQTAEDKLSEKDIYAEDLAGFYNLYNNTFYARDDYSDDEEKEIYRQSVEADLKKQPFLVKNFGNFRYDNFPNEFPEIQESINEEINYATSDNQGLLKNIILKNPSRKELKDNDMTICRIVKDWNGNYYFADSYDFIHAEMVDELFKQKISAVETNLFYNLYNNTFYIRVDHLEDNEIDEYVQKICQELNNSYYMKKEFGNFNCDITYGEL